MPAVVDNDARLADMRDEAETPAELRAAAKFAWKLYEEAVDWLGRQMYRSTYDDLMTRYWNKRREEGTWS